MIEQTLEDYIRDFIVQELDYFELNPYEVYDYWCLFNLCTPEEEVIVKEQLDIIKKAKDIISSIQDDCYGR